jgi:antitoxin component of MazEF toxin-antitoxin module
LEKHKCKRNATLKIKLALMQTQIVAIGNSYGLRLPKPVLDALHLEKGSHVSIQLRKDSIVLRPAPKPLVKTPRADWFDYFTRRHECGSS